MHAKQCHLVAVILKSFVEFWRGIWRGIPNPMSNGLLRGILAWDGVFLAWDPESHAESHAGRTLAWETIFGVEFGVGNQFWRGIRRGILFSAWDSAWDSPFGVGGTNPMPKFGVGDPLGTYIHVYIHIYIYIYIERERDVYRYMFVYFAICLPYISIIVLYFCYLHNAEP